MKERLIEFLSFLRIGQTKFEEKVGLSRGFVNNIGDNITEKSLKKITDVYKDLNVNWLKTGEGNMINNGSIGHVTSGNYSPITGNIEINTYRKDLEKANLEIEYLKEILKDKEKIIELLTIINK